MSEKPGTTWATKRAQALQIQFERGRAEMARELLTALEAVFSSDETQYDKLYYRLSAVVHDYRARYPATPAAVESEDGDHGGQ